MSVSTYDGPLGLTVNVRPRDTQVSVGFNSRLVFLAPSTGATGTDPVFIDGAQEAVDAVDNETDALAVQAARQNGATDTYLVPYDPSATDGIATATETAIGLDPRYVVLTSDAQEDIIDAHTVVEDFATDLELTRLWAPLHDSAASSPLDATDVTEASPAVDSHRLVQVAPRYATETFDGSSTQAWLVGAVAGQAATKPLGSSLAYDQITVEGLASEFRPSAVADVAQFTVVTKDQEVVDGLTASSSDALGDVFQAEIVDVVTLGVAEIAKDYAGNVVNTPEQRANLVADVEGFLNDLATDRPPLLSDAGGGDAYAARATLGDTDDAVDLLVGISPVDVMKQITVNLNVSSTVTVGGVEV